MGTHTLYPRSHGARVGATHRPCVCVRSDVHRCVIRLAGMERSERAAPALNDLWSSSRCVSGANRGDSLAKFFLQPNCYESCNERRELPNGDICLPASETCGLTHGQWMGDCAAANRTCFCHTQAKANRCGWEWPFWLPLGVRQRYCAEAFEPNPALSHELQRQASQLVRRGAAPQIRVRNGTAWALSDGLMPFGIDMNFSLGSSLVSTRRRWTSAATLIVARGSASTRLWCTRSMRSPT